MRTLRFAILFALVGAFTGTSAAVAQSPGDESSGQGEAASGGTEERAERELDEMGEGRRSLVDENIEGMSGDEMLERGATKVDQTKSALEESEELVEKARDQEDIERLNRINDKRSAIEGYLKVAEEHYVSLKEAVNSGDRKAAEHHYTLVSVAQQKASEYLEEAKLSDGEVERYAEGTQVEVNRDDELPGDPDYLSEDPVAVETLPELTPFQ